MQEKSLYNQEVYKKMKEEDFNCDFLDQDKLKEQEQKIKDGTIKCNIDNPEDCESCSG